MKFIFKQIDKQAFIRIWNSDFQDGLLDSHKKSFEDSSYEEWKPLYEKYLKVMREVELENYNIGYIFLSPRADGSAHFGYGIYKQHRGKGYAVEMCKHFLKNEIPKLDRNIFKILGTTLVSNIISQEILDKLGFKPIEKIDDSKFGYIRFERDLNFEDWAAK